MDQEQVQQEIHRRHLPYSLQVEKTLESTNTTLLQTAREGQAANHCLVALHQTQGRGRQGKPWIATADGSLTFSVLVEVDQTQHPATALPLKAALALAQAINQPGIQLKWPNDVLNQGRKVAGILVETTEHPSGKPYAVIGVGINLKLDETTQDQIPTPATDVGPLNQEQLLVDFLAALHALMNQTTDDWIDTWNSLCLHHQREVRLISPMGHEQTGLSEGIDHDGQLQLNQNGQLVKIHSGELSLRLS